MRRKDRQVTDNEKIQAVIDSCHCCRIGFNDSGTIYIVPLNFGYIKDNNCYTLYFHSAKEGRKINLIKNSPNVGFEMDTGYQIKTADIACNYSAKFQSIIGNGTVKIVDDINEKIKGLSLLMKHNTGRHDRTFDEKMINAVTVFKLTVTELSCKEHL